MSCLPVSVASEMSEMIRFLLREYASLYTSGLSFLAPKGCHRLLSCGIFTAQFKYHFSRQNSTTLSAHKISNFDPTGLKLQNYVFQRVNFINTLILRLTHQPLKSNFKYIFPLLSTQDSSLRMTDSHNALKNPN